MGMGNQIHASHAGLNLDRSPDKINKGRMHEDKSQFFTGAAHDKSIVAPSEHTALPNPIALHGENNITSQLSEEDIDNATEFTEQFSDANHIALETEQNVIKVGDSADQVEDLTVVGALSHVPENNLKILNQGAIKIKYQASTPDKITPEK